MIKYEKDPLFRMETFTSTPEPQKVIWWASHNDYSEKYIMEEIAEGKHKDKDEKWYGEKNIKNLLGKNIGHYGCVTEDTEVLSSTGWKFFKDVTSEELLATVDKDTFEIFFEKPSALQVHSIDDVVLYVEGASLDFAVTLDHRMLVSHRQKNQKWTKPYFDSAENIYNKPRRFFTSGYIKYRKPVFNPFNIDNATFARLIGFYCGDGFTAKPKGEQLRFRLKKQRKINYLLSLGLPVNKMANHTYTINMKGLSRWFYENCRGEEGEKTFPTSYFSATVEEVEGLTEGLIHSDGKINKKSGSVSFGNTSKELVDRFQVLLHLNGKKANIFTEAKANPNHSDFYTLTISDRVSPRLESNQEGRGKSYTQRIERYKGNVYCATMSKGTLIFRRNGKVLINGNCTEHPHITLAVGYFPHCVMAQARTHRIATFDVQSMRYSGMRFVDFAEAYHNNQLDDPLAELEKIIYLRPVGKYLDRKGGKFEYTSEWREAHLERALNSVLYYADDIYKGMVEEQARSLLPYDFRQHFMFTVNLRSAFHFLDLRSKADAQLEIRQFSDLLFDNLLRWCPELTSWYEENRLHRAKLAP